jgi:hypothetical protein
VIDSLVQTLILLFFLRVALKGPLYDPFPEERYTQPKKWENFLPDDDTPVLMERRREPPRLPPHRP